MHLIPPNPQWNQRKYRQLSTTRTVVVWNATFNQSQQTMVILLTTEVITGPECILYQIDVNPHDIWGPLKYLHPFILNKSEMALCHITHNPIKLDNLQKVHQIFSC
jgi:hypothetical protein